MGNWHLDQLQIALARAGWKLADSMPGKYHGIGGIWQIVSAKQTAFIEFHVESDCPDRLEYSYGCAVRYNPNIALHFYTKKADWEPELKQFVKDLSKVDQLRSGAMQTA